MSEPKIDAVLSYHMNPHTCGVAKFNHRLAKTLGVPCVGLGARSQYRNPLVSIKWEELDAYAATALSRHAGFDVFWHDQGHAQVTIHARHVYAANCVIADAIRSIRPDVIEAWCPSTIDGNPTRGTINVLTFGMAHKIQTERYAKLKALLDATGEDYTVSISTAIHEGSPWDETAAVGDRLRPLFADRLRVLGYLADDALAQALRECSAVALFFDPAVRANNTTFWAAIESGALVITNADAHSPDAVYHDIDALSVWPMRRGHRRREHAYTWEHLSALMRGQLCAK